MPPVLRPEQVIIGLENNGFRFVKQRGSHRKYKKTGELLLCLYTMRLQKAHYRQYWSKQD